MNLKRRLAHAGSQAFLYPHWRVFHHALQSPFAVQKERLFSILRANAQSAYGKKHHFQKIIRSGLISAYQQKVPIIQHSDIEDEIQRIANGESSVLTEEPVLAFERSSGSTASSKLIPITHSLLSEFHRGVYPWLYDMSHQYPRLKSKNSYWSISTMARQPEISPGGIPIGFTDDTAYFSGFLGWSIRQRLSVPGQVAKAPNMDACRYQTNLFLLADEELGFFSVWSPTFLILLMEKLCEDLPQLIDDLSKGAHGVPASPLRAKYLSQHAWLHGKLNTGAIWPGLSLISCWTSATSAPFLPQLRSLFPGIPIQGKGLLATEGIISIPWGKNHDHLPCLNAHFLEFEDVNSPKNSPKLVDDLEEDGCYSPLLTTGGGLYRYRLGDVVQVMGKINRCPILKFIGRHDLRSDLCGEKLQPIFVSRAIDTAQQKAAVVADFAMLAPELGSPPKYLLFLQSRAQNFSGLQEALEKELAQNHHYLQCRRLGQLGPIEIIPVSSGTLRYESALIAQGVRAGDIKPTALHPALDWRLKMTGQSS